MDSPTLSTEQPAHIIVFRHVVPENVELLADVLGATREAPDADAGAQSTSRTILSVSNGVHARVYTRLGLAVATLTPAQIYELRQLGDILTIAPDEERRLPDIQQDPADTPLDAEGIFRQIGLDPNDPTRTGQGVRVAVLDTGVDLNHPDLHIEEANTKTYIPGTTTVQDDHGHGTHCAGVIAGSAAPAGGVRYGVAPNVTLFVAKVLDHKGSGRDAVIIDAIDWAASQGADVISLSLGSRRRKDAPYTLRYETLARRLLDRGVLLVAAAGNDSARPDYTIPVGNPAACPSIMAVSAVDHHDGIADFACTTMDAIGVVDIAAPGVGVLSAWPGGGVKRMSGTSMATPHVAGVAALYLQQDPGRRGRALWDALKTRAKKVPTLSVDDAGAGIVQAP